MPVMSTRDEDLAALEQLNDAYNQAIDHASRLRRQRDQAALAVMEDQRARLKEIADALGISVGRVHQIIVRARKDSAQQ